MMCTPLDESMASTYILIFASWRAKAHRLNDWNKRAGDAKLHGLQPWLQEIECTSCVAILLAWITEVFLRSTRARVDSRHSPTFVPCNQVSVAKLSLSKVLLVSLPFMRVFWHLDCISMKGCPCEDDTWGVVSNIYYRKCLHYPIYLQMMHRSCFGRTPYRTSSPLHACVKISLLVYACLWQTSFPVEIACFGVRLLIARNVMSMYIKIWPASSSSVGQGWRPSHQILWIFYVLYKGCPHGLWGCCRWCAC